MVKKIRGPMDPLFPAPPRPYSPYAPSRRGTTRKPRIPPLIAPSKDWVRLATVDGYRTEIDRIGRQLAKVAEEVPWGRVQNDAWDRLCPFIFRVRTVDQARVRAEEVDLPRDVDRAAVVDYVLRRWYCFWGARVAELLFLGHSSVEPGPPKHHEIDFTIDGVPFDLKTTELPPAFLRRLGELQIDPSPLITWLYEHQSRERRFHAANRLFLVLSDPDSPSETWRLRGDVAALRTSVDAFLASPRYVNVSVVDRSDERHEVVSGASFVVPPAIPRQLALPTAATESTESVEASRQMLLPIDDAEAR